MLTVAQLRKKLEALEEQDRRLQASKYPPVIIIDPEDPPTDEQIKLITGQAVRKPGGKIIILPDDGRNPGINTVYSRSNC